MKLTKTDLQILKNFASVNTSMWFVAGRTQRVFSRSENILAERVFDFEAPFDFGIHDLNQFLNIISLFETPDIEVTDKEVVVRGGSAKSVYRHSPKKIIDRVGGVAPLMQIETPNSLTFDLGRDEIKKLLSAASTLQLPDFVFCFTEENCKIKITNIREKDINTYEHVLSRGATQDSDFIFETALPVEDIIIPPADYTVAVSKAGIVKFECEQQKLKYWITTKG